MPKPTSSLSTLRPDLTQSMMEFDLQAERNGFIGLSVMPAVNVSKQAGNFGKIPIEQLLQSPDTARAPGSGYGRGKWDFESDTYATKEHGWEEVVDDREAEMYSDYFEAEVISAMRARDFVLRNYERRVASAVFNTSTWTATSITNEWDDSSNATPITDVLGRAKAMHADCGLWPNALIINRYVYLNLLECDEILDKVKYVRGTLPGELGVNDLRLAFDLPYILVAGGAYNANAEGQSASLSPIWSNEYAAVARIATGNDFREPCVGRTFHWSEDGSTIGGAMESYRDESVRGEVIRARMDTDEKVIYTNALQLLDNVTT